MMRYVLALDFGASAGRAMLAGFDGSRITLQEVHRFANEPVSKDGRLYWNVPQLMEELEQGLQAGYAIAPYESIAIDTWGVDYGMLGADGTLLELPRHYRDGRTDGILQKAEQLLPAAELYRRTGTQVMEINTLFQLLCQRDSGGFDQCATILPMPDLFAYLLTGTISAERSIASTTQMLSAETGTWDRELLELFHIPHRILPEIVESGTAKGTLSPEVQQRLGLPAIRVTAVCGHDTQCAAFAAPAKTDKHVFLSCGTWSLFGTEPEQPVLTEQAAALGLSNEVGYGKRVTFLKNIIGLWLLQESRREYARQGKNYSFAEIETMARQSHEPSSFIDPDDPVFVPHGDIPKRVQAFCRKTGQHVPESDGAIFRCIYESLALKYRMALEELEACTGETYPVIHIMGGGVKDSLLCQLTADYCQRPVAAGPVEATVYGNAAIQMLALGILKTPAEARRCIAASESMQFYHAGAFPASSYEKYRTLLK